MTDEPTGGQPDGGTPPAATPGTQGPAPESQPQDASVRVHGAASPEDVSKIAAREVAKATKSLSAELETAAKERDALLAEKQTRERAEMTELQRLQAATAEATAEAQRARAEAQAEKLQSLRAKAVLKHLPSLPSAYHDQVRGETEEEIEESATAVLTAFEADMVALKARAQQDVLAFLASAPAEEIAKLGDFAKPLAERLGGKPAPIGAPANPPGQAPPPILDWANPPDPDTDPKAYADWRRRAGLTTGLPSPIK